MDGKLSARRRVSAITTAPSAPKASSSHMNQNRFWPGVPKRYTTRSSLIVMRPKSIATVVVDLRSSPSRSSNSELGSLSASSVRSGRTSLTEPTRVVLPTPKPPAMRILIATGTDSRSPVGSELAKGIGHLLQDPQIAEPDRRGRLDAHEAAFSQVSHENADDAQREVEGGRQVGDRYWSQAELQHAPVLVLQLKFRSWLAANRADLSHQVDRGPAWSGPPCGQRVGPDDRPSVPGLSADPPGVPRSGHVTGAFA